MKTFFSIFIILLSTISAPLFGQTKSLNLQECIDQALKNNENIKILDLNIRYQGCLKKSSFETPKTTVMYTQGQFNSIYKYDNNITVAQSLPFPAVFSNNQKLHNESIKSAEYNVAAAKADLVYQIKTVYYSILYTEALHALLLKEDSIYVDFANIILEKYKKGEAGFLDKTGTETQVMEIKNQMLENEEDLINYQIQLQTLMNSTEQVHIQFDGYTNALLHLAADSTMSNDHPVLKYLKQQETVNNRLKKLETSKMLPDITVAYFNQSIYGPANVFGEDYFLTTKNRLQGFQVGLALPLWYHPLKAKTNALQVNTEIAQLTYEHNQTLMNGQYQQALVQYEKYQNSINYYKSNALSNSALLMTEALDAYKRKEISYVDYLQIVSKALDIECNYLRVLHQNNLTVLKIQYLMEK